MHRIQLSGGNSITVSDGSGEHTVVSCKHRVQLLPSNDSPAKTDTSLPRIMMGTQHMKHNTFQQQQQQQQQQQLAACLPACLLAAAAGAGAAYDGHGHDHDNDYGWW